MTDEEPVGNDDSAVSGSSSEKEDEAGVTKGRNVHRGDDEEEEEEEDDNTEEEDSEDDKIATSSSDEEEDDTDEEENADMSQRDPNTKGFLEGGKVDSFSRAFKRLVNNVDGSSKAPILAGSKSVHRRKEEEKLELEAAKAAKKLREEMKKRGHYLPVKKGVDPRRDNLEKRLIKTATKGVVQLFNAINTAQKRIRSEETQGNKAKVAKLGKAGFLAGIRQVRERQQREEVAGARKADAGADDAGVEEEPVGGKWDVLKDGFAGLNDSSVRMRDWDSKGDQKGEGESEVGGDDDSESDEGF